MPTQKTKQPRSRTARPRRQKVGVTSSLPRQSSLPQTPLQELLQFLERHAALAHGCQLLVSLEKALALLPDCDWDVVRPDGLISLNREGTFTTEITSMDDLIRQHLVVWGESMKKLDTLLGDVFRPENLQPNMEPLSSELYPPEKSEKAYQNSLLCKDCSYFSDQLHSDLNAKSNLRLTPLQVVLRFFKMATPTWLKFVGLTCQTLALLPDCDWTVVHPDQWLKISPDGRLKSTIVTPRLILSQYVYPFRQQIEKALKPLQEWAACDSMTPSAMVCERLAAAEARVMASGDLGVSREEEEQAFAELKEAERSYALLTHMERMEVLRQVGHINPSKVMYDIIPLIGCHDHDLVLANMLRAVAYANNDPWPMAAVDEALDRLNWTFDD